MEDKITVNGHKRPAHRGAYGLKITSKYFGCTICHCVLLPSEKYVFCGSDHIICPKCAEVNTECPAEHAKTEDPTSRAFGKCKYPLYEAIVQAGLYTCMNCKQGCTKSLTYHEFDSHVKGTCPFRNPNMCFVSGCYFSTTGNDLSEHYKEYHAVRTLDNSRNVKLILLYNRPEREMVFFTKSFQWVSTNFKFDDTHVLLTAREEDGKLTLWLMSYDRIENAAEKYAATITVVLSERREEFTMDIFQYPEDPRDCSKRAAILSMDEVKHNLYAKTDFPGCWYMVFTIDIEKVIPDEDANSAIGSPEILNEEDMADEPTLLANQSTDLQESDAVSSEVFVDSCVQIDKPHIELASVNSPTTEAEEKLENQRGEASNATNAVEEFAGDNYVTKWTRSQWQRLIYLLEDFRSLGNRPRGMPDDEPAYIPYTCNLL